MRYYIGVIFVIQISNLGLLFLRCLTHHYSNRSVSRELTTAITIGLRKCKNAQPLYLRHFGSTMTICESVSRKIDNKYKIIK